MFLILPHCPYFCVYISILTPILLYIVLRKICIKKEKPPNMYMEVIFMKKIIIFLAFVLIFYLFVSDLMVQGLEIPDDAIRIRVVPNSNSENDQEIKNKVKEELQSSMYELLKDSKTSSEAEKIINENLNKIDKDINNLLIKEKYNKGYVLNYGYNYFPEKEYKGITYEEGYYKSLLVTLGEGKGDNWWCVLFPPLCLIEEDNTEYKSLAKQILEEFSNNLE